METSNPQPNPWIHRLALVSNWAIKHSKNITFLLMGLACVWAFVYSLVYTRKIEPTALQLVGIVFGLGAWLAGWKAHTEAKANAAAPRDQP